MSFPVEGDGSLNDIFQRVPIAVMALPPNGVYCLNSSTSVADAARELGKRNILCAPVIDESKPAGTSWTEKYMGIVDFLAIVDWMCKESGVSEPNTLEELISLKVSFCTTPISVVSQHARWSQFVPLDYQRDNLLDVMLLLGKYGVHRVCAVQTGGGDLANIITQSAMVNLLHNNLSTLGDSAKKPVSAFGIPSGLPVASVKYTDTYWSAFRIMSENLVSAVAVVDDNGVLVGNVSVKDLRDRLRSDRSFGALCTPINKSPDFYPVHYTCTAESTLEEIIHKLNHTRIHRLYVVDGAGKPTGVVALREVIAAMVKEPKDSNLYKYFECRVSAH